MPCSICKTAGHNKNNRKFHPLTKTDVVENMVTSPQMSLAHEYPYMKELNAVCQGFVGEIIPFLTTTFRGTVTQSSNVDSFGDTFQELIFPYLKQALPDFEKGRSGSPPDFYGLDKRFSFELKVFKDSPGFDISNFTSFINQIATDGGLIPKIFKTKYIVFKYTVVETGFKITDLWIMDIWNLPKYDGKNAISCQKKHGMCYNLRSGSSSSWNDKTKNAKIFLDSILLAMDLDDKIQNKEKLRESIMKNMEEAKTLGFL